MKHRLWRVLLVGFATYFLTGCASSIRTRVCADLALIDPAAHKICGIATPPPTVAPPPTIAPTVAPTGAPTIAPTSAPPDTLHLPPNVETFRGGLGDAPKWTKQGELTCAEGGATIWFWLQRPLTCPPRFTDRAPCDNDHFSCADNVTNCGGRPWDDPRGPALRVIAGDGVTFTRGANPYSYTVCARPGPVSYATCPKAGFHACASPTTDDESCQPVPLHVRDGDGCARHDYVFPAL